MAEPRTLAERRSETEAFRILFFELFKAAKLGSVEHFDKKVFEIADKLGYGETFRAAGARHTDSRHYKRWKAGEMI